MLTASSSSWKEKAFTILTCVSFLIQRSLSNLSREESNMFVDRTLRSYPYNNGNANTFSAYISFCVYIYALTLLSSCQRRTSSSRFSLSSYPVFSGARYHFFSCSFEIGGAQEAKTNGATVMTRVNNRHLFLARQLTRATPFAFRRRRRDTRDVDFDGCVVGIKMTTTWRNQSDSSLFDNRLCLYRSHLLHSGFLLLLSDTRVYFLVSQV